MSITKSKLASLAVHFRFLIEKADKAKLPVTFRNFPKGCCGDTCLLLIRFLHDNGYKNLQYVAGWNKDQSHAWIKYANIYLDITADQFGQDKIIVTEKSEFHERFQIDEIRQDPKIEMYEPSTKMSLLLAYDLILSSGK